MLVWLYVCVLVANCGMVVILCVMLYYQIKIRKYIVDFQKITNARLTSLENTRRAEYRKP